jgi:hypothetical protein
MESNNVPSTSRVKKSKALTAARSSAEAKGFRTIVGALIVANDTDIAVYEWKEESGKWEETFYGRRA